MVVLVVVACGPGSSTSSGSGSGSDSDASTASGSGDSGTTDPSATSTAPGESDTTIADDSGSTAMTVDTSTTSADSDASSTTDADDCVEGIFDGIWHGYMEGQAFESCDGETWWIDQGELYAMSCREGVWLRIEGRVCSSLGTIDYARGLEGSIVQGPCAAACGDEPDASQCGTLAEVCAPR